MAIAAWSAKVCTRSISSSVKSRSSIRASEGPEDRSVADEGNVEEWLGPARSCELRRAARGTPVVLGEVGHLDRPLFEMGSADEGVRADRHPAAFYRSRDDLGVQLRRDGEHVRIAHRAP